MPWSPIGKDGPPFKFVSEALTDDAATHTHQESMERLMTQVAEVSKESKGAS